MYKVILINDNEGGLKRQSPLTLNIKQITSINICDDVKFIILKYFNEIINKLLTF